MNMILIPVTKISILPCPDDAKKSPRERIAVTGKFSLCLRGYIVEGTTGHLPGLPLTVSPTLTDT
jgi:hypothetical protein